MDHILFSLFISDLVFFIQQSSLSNYIDALLCTDIKIVENWLFENYIVLNPEKCLCVSAKMLLIQSYLTLMTKF